MNQNFREKATLLNKSFQVLSNARGVLCTGGQFFPESSDTGASSEWVCGSIKTGLLI
jgi:hypothetical protein